ncbi:unnamed protein product [Acidithrix sp. C25]|nr:unnamed protein product [Acidithrix sp. C25]CAG4930238.1 unnamed protein product [Acidithrix sp. C25]
MQSNKLAPSALGHEVDMANQLTWRINEIVEHSRQGLDPVGFVYMVTIRYPCWFSLVKS